MNQIKRTYDDHLANLNREHQEILSKLQDEHQIEIENVKTELKQFFDIENEAQNKFYLQTIEDLKRKHQDLLQKEKAHQMTQHELGEEFLQEKTQLEKRIEDLENHIEQIQVQSQLELTEQKNLFEIKSNEYKQLQYQFEQYQLNFNANSNDIGELNEVLTKQRDDYEQLKQKLEKTNREMNTVKERFNRQANELEEKLSKKQFLLIIHLDCCSIV
jgi:chromosome segregation ATPase